MQPINAVFFVVFRCALVATFMFPGVVYMDKLSAKILPRIISMLARKNVSLSILSIELLN